MTREEMRKFGEDLVVFIDQKAGELGLSGEGMVMLLLSVTYGAAEKAGLNPKGNPRALFDRAVKVWDALSRGTLIEVVEHVKPSDIVEINRN